VERFSASEDDSKGSLRILLWSIQNKIPEGFLITVKLFLWTQASLRMKANEEKEKGNQLSKPS
jgi:hypothetical protein